MKIETILKVTFMQKFFQQFLIIALLVTLTGCNMLFDKDNIPTPTPLKDFSATHQAKQLWQTSTGNGSGKKYIKLIPAQANNLIFTASTQGKITAVNKNNGKIIWQIDTHEPISSGIAAWLSCTEALVRSALTGTPQSAVSRCSL